MKLELELTDEEVSWVIEINDETKWGPRSSYDLVSPNTTVALKLYQAVNPYDVQWRRLVGV